MSIRNALLHVLSIIGFAAAATAYTEHPSRGPELLFRGPGDAKPIAAPHLSMEVAISVTGPVTRARVLQRFWNDSDGWVEGVYVFPLPEGAAVDALRMRVVGRLFEREVREREEAKRTYHRARSSGNKASLVDHDRPKLFTV